jgi:hypothetical protein
VWLVVLVAIAVAYSYPVHSNRGAASSNFALVKALADGTPWIDAYASETADTTRSDEHVFSNKPPGLALLAVPVYEALRATHAVSQVEHRVEFAKSARSVIAWALRMAVVTLPALMLLVLVRSSVERVLPGTGGLTAVLLGLGTLLFPYATLLSSHVLATVLGFTAFVLVWRERERGARWGPVGMAGILAGYAVATEYVLALVAAILLGYVASGATARLRRLVAYTVGLGMGVLPLLLYNTWAFGSPTRLSYRGTSTGEHASGFYGVDFPDPERLAYLFAAPKGLLVVTPIVAVGMAGLPALARRGWKAEAVVIAVVTVSFLLYNAGYFSTFGGEGPGPRLLLPIVPFLAPPLALALRAAPGATVALGGVSVFMMLAATVTQPLIRERATPGRWLTAMWNGELAPTVSGYATGTWGWPAAIPLVAAVGVAFALCLRAAASIFVWRAGTMALEGGLAIALWLLIALVSARYVDGHGDALLSFSLTAAAVLAWLAAARMRRLGDLNAGAPLRSDAA